MDNPNKTATKRWTYGQAFDKIVECVLETFRETTELVADLADGLSKAPKVSTDDLGLLRLKFEPSR